MHYLEMQETQPTTVQMILTVTRKPIYRELLRNATSTPLIMIFPSTLTPADVIRMEMVLLVVWKFCVMMQKQ